MISPVLWPRGLLAASLASVFGFACTNAEFVAADSAPAQSPIINGTPSARGAVVALQLRSEGLTFCSGTLISRRVVLTAAHCAEAALPEEIDVFFGPRDDGPGARRALRRANLHPQWDPYAGFDLALLELVEDAPSDVAPVPHLPGSLGLAQRDMGEVLTFAGYGLTEQGTGGERFEAQGEITAFCLGEEPCERGQMAMYARSFAYAHTAGGPCSGDSGGPAFITRDGALYVAGVNSAVEDTDDNCSRASYGINTIVDSSAELIERFIAGEDIGPTPAPPEPVVCAGPECTPGASCRDELDCGGTALCISEEYDFPGGYCSSHCTSDAHCAPGSVCEAGPEEMGYCFATCVSDADCRDGYECIDDGMGNRVCYPEFVTGETPVGGKCQQHSECVGGYCWTEEQAQVPGGYCTAQCRNDADCPGSSYCDQGACIASCQRNSDCGRDDFVCWPNEERPGEGVCWFPCVSDADCDGEVCNAEGMCGTQAPPLAEEPVVEPGEDGATATTSDESAGGDDEGCAAVSGSPWLVLALVPLRRRRRS